MNGSEVLLKPDECALILADLQAGLAFAVESAGRQALVNNAVALAKVARTFHVPVIATTSASKVYSGPLQPQVQAALPDTKAFERRNMNAWEDGLLDPLERAREFEEFSRTARDYIRAVRQYLGEPPDREIPISCRNHSEICQLVNHVVAYRIRSLRHYSRQRSTHSECAEAT